MLFCSHSSSSGYQTFFSRFAQPHRLAYRIRFCLIAAVLTSATLCAQVKTQAHATERFIDSMGVNVHMEYTNTPYGNYALINERLRELGMRHIRDEINNTTDPFVDELNTIGTLGYKLCGLIEGGNDYPWVGETLEASKVVPMLERLLPTIDAVEGPNEPDDSSKPPFQYGIDRLLYPGERSMNLKRCGVSSNTIPTSATFWCSRCPRERLRTSRS